MKKVFRPLLWSAMAMFMVTTAVSFLAFGGLLKKELFFSWFLNLFNAYLFALISKKALGKEQNTFLSWALLGHGVRFLMVLIAVGIVILTEFGHQESLIIFVLLGYFVFTIGEVRVLLQMNEQVS